MKRPMTGSLVVLKNQWDGGELPWTCARHAGMDQWYLADGLQATWTWRQIQDVFEVKMVVHPDGSLMNISEED